MSALIHLRNEVEVLQSLYAAWRGQPDPRTLQTPPAPPLALIGPQRIPFLGIYWRLKSIITEPTQLADRCRQTYGDVFTIRIPFNFDLTYVVSNEAYRQILGMDPDAARMGPVMSNVPTVGFWYPRSDPSHEGLQALLLAGRQHLAAQVRSREQLIAMEPVIQRTLERHVARWGDTVDLGQDLVQLIFDAAGRCIVGEALWDRIGEAVSPLYRTIVNGIDIVHTTLTVVFGRLTPEARATRRLQRVLDAVIAEHQRTRAWPVLDQIAAIEVDGQPLSLTDQSWMLMYLIWNALIYPGTYGVWSLLDLLGQPALLADIHGADQRQQSRLLHLALLETIRLNPVSSLVRSHAQPVDFLVDGRAVRVPSGGYVGVFPWAQCHDPSAYHDPYQYNPYRYLDGEPLPPVFGRGPFGCVAQGFVRLLMGTIQRELVDRYHWTLVDAVPPRRSRVHLTYPSVPVRARKVARGARQESTSNPDLEAALQELPAAEAGAAK